MKSKLCLAALLFLFLSGCVNYPVRKGEFTSYSETKTNDLEYAVDLYPSEISAGESIKVRIKITPSKDIENVRVRISDPCILEVKRKEKKLGDISANSQRIVNFELKAPSHVDIATQCKIKFEIEYEARFYSAQDIAVLSSAEYREKASSGKLGEIKISSSKIPSAIEIEVSFSEQEPFRDGKEMFMYIDYFNRGNGIPEPLKNVALYIPSNLKVKECSSEYALSPFKLSLSKEIEFYRNRAKRSVCKVEARANTPVDIQKLSVEAKYKYTLEDYVTVEVVP